MTHGTYRTDYRIWAFLSACAFVALGFLDPVAGVAKGNESLWGHVVDLFTGRYGRTNEILPKILLFASVLGGAATAIGWVAHAFVVIFWTRLLSAGAAERR